MNYFRELDIRIGTVADYKLVKNVDLDLVVAYILYIDLGENLERKAYANLVMSYPDPAVLLKKQVVCALNVPVEEVGGEKLDLMMFAYPNLNDFWFY